MRDVAVVSYACSSVARDSVHNETELIVPVLRRAMAESGVAKDDIGFVCSGSLDYLQGGPFAFVAGLDAVGAWPPVRESHVEMTPVSRTSTSIDVGSPDLGSVPRDAA